MRLILDPSEDDILHIFLLRLYYTCLAIVWLYSFSRWKNLLVAVYQYYVSDQGQQPKAYGHEEIEEQNDVAITLIKRWEAEEESGRHQTVDEEIKDQTVQCELPIQTPVTATFPAVTVQILSYNEGAVIEETICRACALDWPREALFVQILDDSTEESSRWVVQQCVERLRLHGCNVEVLYRPNREGYKAGNLAFHSSSIRTQFVLYLDGFSLVRSCVRC